MTESLKVNAQSVARRCSCRNPEYNALTAVDWIVLDFTDGLRTFEELQTMVPVRRDDLVSSFLHLHELGMLKWSDSTNSQSSSFANNARFTSDSERSKIPASPGLTGGLSSSRNVPKISLSMTSTSSFSDEVCAQYLPARLFSEFRRFQPSLLDEKLDIPVETQAFAEFIHDNLSSLSHYDLLGLTEGQSTKSDVKQAYLLRTKQFHPDRYFRKNIGPFAPRIAAIFKAITAAFTALQRTV